MNPSPEQIPGDEAAAWNEAHDRVLDFLRTFALGDHAQVSRITLKLIDQAQEIHRGDRSSDPVLLAMSQAHQMAREWFSANLEMKDRPASQVIASGYLALLLSRTFHRAPDAVFTAPLPDNLRESMRQTLVVIGPDLKISSMTPRALDYGPMLDLARSTWHRWNAREIILAVLFWAGVYCALFWWFSQNL